MLRCNPRVIPSCMIPVIESPFKSAEVFRSERAPTKIRNGTIMDRFQIQNINIVHLAFFYSHHCAIREMHQKLFKVNAE